MRDGDTGEVGGDGCGEDLITVAQHHQKIRAVGGEIIGKGAQGRAGGAGHTGLAVILQRFSIDLLFLLSDRPDLYQHSLVHRAGVSADILS